jgi:PKD repeat protein
LIFSHFRLCVVLVAVLLTAACQQKKPSPVCGKVLLLAGTASGAAAGQLQKAKPLAPQAPVHAGMTVSVSQGSRCVIDVGGGRTISSSGPAQFVIDSLDGMPPLTYPVIRLISGEYFFRTLAQVEFTASAVRPVRITPSVEGTQFSLRLFPSSQSAILTVVAGIVGVKTPDSKEIDVPSCFKMLVKSEGGENAIVPATARDFQNLAPCAGATADSLERLTFCKQIESESLAPKTPEPPQWLKAPISFCLSGSLFLDTLSAKSPLGGSITYTLVNGPKGMTLDGKTGVLQYGAKKTGAFDIQVSAQDSAGAAATTSYKLTVLARQAAKNRVQAMPSVKQETVEKQPVPPLKVPPQTKVTAQEPQTQTQTVEARTAEIPAISVTLDLPSMAQPGDTVVIDASRSKDPLDSTAPLSFRFDADGDGTWDVPPASGYSNSGRISHVYPKDGVYRVIAEAQGKNNRTSRAEGRLMVRTAPTATIEIKPVLPVAGTVCTLDARKSTVSPLGKQSFVVRWDLDNNGTWDVPAGGGFSSAMTALKPLDGPGPFRVVLQVKDEAGLTSKAIAEIPITPVFKVILLSMPDTALTDISFSAACQTSYPPSEIAEYDWDFSGDGSSIVKQEKHLQPHEYKKPGTYKVSCRAIARNGNQSAGTRTIMVVSRSVTVKAKVPAQAQAMIAAEFDGEISPHHTKIASVGWDFDGDGVFDWSAPSSPKTKHAFVKAGTYHPVLRAISVDKHEWLDTASIAVVPNVPPRAVAGQNILARKGDNVDLSGTGVVSSGRIILYEWDFDNDGKYDWKSDKSGEVTHRYLVFSRAVLRVTAESGVTATDTLTVVICPDGMTGIRQGSFCIDKYEFPNGKGQIPTVNVSYTDAEQLCGKENKRLCTGDEWERACSGGGKQRYPQPSSQYSGEPCNTQTRNSLGHITQSGSFEECKSPSGQYDMNGNVAEWTSPVKNGSAFAYGGSWLFPPDKATCSSKIELKAGGSFPYVGFRCCK